MTCPVRTEMQGHLFACELTEGHDGPHVWWLAHPVNTWIDMPETWTAALLVEDDWNEPAGAAAPRKDGKETADKVSLSTADRIETGGTHHRKAD